MMTKKAKKITPAEPLPAVEARPPVPPPRPIADDEGQLHLPGVKPEPAPPPAATPRGWTWPARSRCPRCGSTETKRVSDDGPTQYRRCERAICRHSYKVQGTVL